MRYKCVCKKCGGYVKYSDLDEYIVCPQCGWKRNNPHYDEIELLEDVIEEPVVKPKAPKKVASKKIKTTTPKNKKIALTWMISYLTVFVIVLIISMVTYYNSPVISSKNNGYTGSMSSSQSSNSSSYSGSNSNSKSSSKSGSTYLRLNKTSANLNIGDYLTLTASQDGSEKVTWDSSNVYVATVSSGRVTAKNSGYCNITAKLPSGLSASCSIYVQADTIYLNYSSAELYIGDSFTLVATRTGSKTVTWSSSNSYVASVSSSGKVVAKNEGYCIITAKLASGVSATCSITVVDPGVTLTSRNIDNYVNISVRSGTISGNKATFYTSASLYSMYKPKTSISITISISATAYYSNGNTWTNYENVNLSISQYGTSASKSVAIYFTSIGTSSSISRVSYSYSIVSISGAVVSRY